MARSEDKPGKTKPEPQCAQDIAMEPARARQNLEPAPGGAASALSAQADVDAFVARLKATPMVGAAGNGRLIFAMDATMSRQPTWDMALALQADMFEAVRDVGGLDVQLVYFRGHGECRASKWVADARTLARLMTTVACQGGYTQIGKVLSHATAETRVRRVNALVYVGDAMEEAADDLCGRAGELALLGVPAFFFQEGRDRAAGATFAEMARISRGAHCQFDAGSAAQLKALLAAVATFAAGGRAALEAAGGRGDSGAKLLIGQMRD